MTDNSDIQRIAAVAPELQNHQSQHGLTNVAFKAAPKASTSVQTPIDDATATAAAQTTSSCVSVEQTTIASLDDELGIPDTLSALDSVTEQSPKELQGNAQNYSLLKSIETCYEQTPIANNVGTIPDTVKSLEDDAVGEPNVNSISNQDVVGSIAGRMNEEEKEDMAAAALPVDGLFIASQPNLNVIADGPKKENTVDGKRGKEDANASVSGEAENEGEETFTGAGLIENDKEAVNETLRQPQQQLENQIDDEEDLAGAGVKRQQLLQEKPAMITQNDVYIRETALVDHIIVLAVIAGLSAMLLSGILKLFEY